MKVTSISRAAGILALTFTISAFLGFIRSRLLYSEFFACCARDLDVFNAASRLPDMLYNLLVGGALTSSFIPVFSKYLHQEPDKSNSLASAVLTILVSSFIFLSLIIFIFARPMSELITPGFAPEQIELLVNLTRLLLLAQIFFLFSNFTTGVLQTYHYFTSPALSPIFYNIAIILSILFLSKPFGVFGVVYGTIFGSILHLLVQLPNLFRAGVHLYLNFNFKTPGFLSVLKLMLPRSLSLGLAEVESTLVLIWASSFSSGSLSLFKLALQVIYLPSRIFGVSFGQATLPELSKNIAQNRVIDFSKVLESSLLKSSFLALPVTIICIVNRVPIVRIAYGSREFPWSATLDTAQTLAFLTPLIFTQATIQIINRAFYALKNTRLPLYVSFFSLAGTIFSGFYFYTFTSFGIQGLALAISIGGMLQLFGLALMFFIKFKNYLNWSSLITGLKKQLLSSLLMGISVWAIMKSLDIYILDTTKAINVFLVFVGSSVLGFSIYLLSLIIFKSQEVLWLIDKTKIHRFVDKK